MVRKTVKVDRGVQFDLLGDDSPVEDRKRPLEPNTGRVFNAPDRTELFFGMQRLDQYLKQAGQTTPLSMAKLLDEYDWSEFESRYAQSGRAPYAPQAMCAVILYGVMQGVNSLRGLEKLARMDLGCLWISGGVCPDHASIGRFIVLHAESFGTSLFEQITRSALRSSDSDGRRVAGDGTVVEAACSYYALLHEEAIRTHVEKKKKSARERAGE